MALDVVAICNIALSYVSANAIQALTGVSKEARECNKLYESARDSVLEDHDWGFARKHQVLALSTETFTGWTYAYAWPSDCLAPRKIVDETGTNTGTSYDIDTDRYIQYGKVKYEIRVSADLSQRFIVSDKEDAELVYTAAVSNPTLFSPLFVACLAWKLGAELAQPLRAKPALHSQLRENYLFELAKAKASSANIDHAPPNDTGDFVRARL